MATQPVRDSLLYEAVKALADHEGNKTGAADALGLPRNTYAHRLKLAARRGITSEGVTPEFTLDPVDHIRLRLKRAESELRAAKEASFDDVDVREAIIKLAQDVSATEPPDWIVTPHAAGKSPGVPTLMASDWHVGEIIDPAQIGGINSYNMAIAKERAKRLIDTTIDLLHSHMVNPQYPGIVFALAGDMVSGNIHEKLMVTNEAEIMPVVVELFGILTWCIETLAEAFGNVFVPCVAGNHGRDTAKVRAKGFGYTSFDWLAYMFLAKRFEEDRRVSFLIPKGPDAIYRVFNHRYLLTHGNQYRGGDGLIGCLGPIIRGDHKKRSRNGQIDMGYDTQLIGHFHQLIQLQRVIVNGSLCGYNEYAYSNNFGYEVPRQALWITHPQHGITFSMPVNVDEPREATPVEWVSVANTAIV